MSEQMNTFNSKFQGVFLVPESDQLLKEYKNLIKKLNNLSEKNGFNEFYLSPGIIETIFGSFDESVNSCKVSDELSYFTIVLNFAFKGINRFKTVKLKKNEYKFIYGLNEKVF